MLWSMWSNCLVFCDCAFRSACPLMEKDKRHMEASWWKRLTKGKVGLVLKDWAMLSKSLIYFSVEGWGCVSSLPFDWGQTIVEVMKVMVTSFKRSHACTAALSAPTLQQATADPHLCQRLLDTHRQIWVSLFWGHCSVLLGPGVHKVLFVPSKSLFPSPV